MENAQPNQTCANHKQNRLFHSPPAICIHIRTHTHTQVFISPHLKPGLEPWIMDLCKCLLGITIKDESDWKGILFDWVTAACELWMFAVQQVKRTLLNPKKKAQYFSSKRGGVSVTSTSEEHINAQPDLPIYALLGAFQTSAVLLYPVVELSWAVKSLRTVTSAFTICVMHHRCLFCQTLDCCKMHINVSRHLWWDYSLVRVGLPSTLRLLHHVYVK